MTWLRTTTDTPRDFVPAARLNIPGEQLAVIKVAPDCEIVTSSAEVARQYAAAFTEAARMLDEVTPPEGTKS